jgi:hypothetical protein
MALIRLETHINASIERCFDLFTFHAPLGLFGNLAETLFLTHYMKKLLLTRNTCLKKVAEEGEEPYVIKN